MLSPNDAWRLVQIYMSQAKLTGLQKYTGVSIGHNAYITSQRKMITVAGMSHKVILLLTSELFFNGYFDNFADTITPTHQLRKTI